jgi:hypothetical protein
MLKLLLSATTDDAGNLSAPKPLEADASAYGNELQGLQAAAQFIEKQGLESLRVSYGNGVVMLRKGDDLATKAEDLFYSANAFSLRSLPSLTAPELKLGEPERARNIGEAAHSALRIAQKFNRKVSFTFNSVAVGDVEPKAVITRADIDAVSAKYSEGFKAVYGAGGGFKA